MLMLRPPLLLSAELKNSLHALFQYYHKKMGNIYNSYCTEELFEQIKVVRVSFYENAL